MDILHNLFSFIITLSILVSIHEFGHFWVARRQGVKVLRFSLGFGKVLWRRYDQYQTEYALSLIPLGGYVKMLDEREGTVSPEELHLAFNRKSLWARISIVIAGPVANFILAIFALWFMYLLGFTVLAPITGSITDDSPAAISGMQSNERIVSVNNENVNSWQDIHMILANRIGNSNPFTIATQSNENLKKYTLQIPKWPEDLTQVSFLDIIGIQIWKPEPLMIIGRALEGYPAEQSGLQAGDHIRKINGETINNWSDLVQIISKKPNETIQIDVIRNNQAYQYNLTVGSKMSENQALTGFIGIEAKPIEWPETHLEVLSRNPIITFKKACIDTWKLTCLTARTIFNIVTGSLSIHNLSGPITIAKVASTSLNAGLKNFLYFLAMLSVSLGVINLLPIPTLDGGHLLYYAIELIRGRPISEKMQIFWLRVGLVCILCVMILAIYNDLDRLW